MTTMIHDKMENLLKYIPEKKKEYIERFMCLISEDMREGQYEIDGENIFAKVMAYSTKQEADCIIEAHNIYSDIQFSLTGEEGISVYPRASLPSVGENEAEDFYTFGEEPGLIQAKIYNRAGYFTMIHSDEAHRPQESPDGKCSVVKKGVIKIKESLFNE